MIFKNRRKISNFSIDPKAQLRFAQPFGILILTSFATINLIFWQIFNVRETVGSSAPPESLAVLNGIIGQVTLMACLGMTLMGLLSLVLWIVYSHRIFGPVVPLRRQIESLRAGNYDVRIRLRRNDEFKDLAEELNKLAEHLKKQTPVKT